jgi:hypothetical protein
MMKAKSRLQTVKVAKAIVVRKSLACIGVRVRVPPSLPSSHSEKMSDVGKDNWQFGKTNNMAEWWNW